MGELVKKRVQILLFFIPFFVIMMLNRGQDGVDNKMLYEFQQTLDRKIDRNSSYRFTSGGFNGISKSGKIGKFYSCLRKYQLVKRVHRNIPEMMGLDPEDIHTSFIHILVDDYFELRMQLANSVVTNFYFGPEDSSSRFSIYCDIDLLNS
ncbi:hypothetical protein [Vibrio mangrovi]|uniref:Uncharacterized protein n=1 Tax=Vibrio mangrovi TaxID=474394 RepID=A0A1Y6IYC0_9VIBR|nr:hypothetical protein [Vibrio mangrovi]MDW6002147.1 hypothetical protein [Vibrio mangrovi]SMS01492.1 hypothetical protein VIM7927_02788 [Vibrio mangrovi]